MGLLPPLRRQRKGNRGPLTFPANLNSSPHHTGSQKNDRHLFVRPMTSITADQSDMQEESPYVVEQVLVVGSDNQRSRLRGVPVATHLCAPMANPELHRMALMGGMFANFVHRESNNLLRLDSAAAVSLDRSQTAGDEDVADAWCLQSINLAWSGNVVDGDGTYVLKHGGTSRRRDCHSADQHSLSLQQFL